MRVPLSRMGRVRGTILAIVAATTIAFPIGVLAAHQFADVSNSNIFHGDIDALVDAGITAGCGGSNYCPNQAVTRGQMAAFMNRLGALAPGKVPVVNADRVDGYQANELGRVAQTVSSTIVPLTDANATLSSVALTAPTAGFVHVTATLTAYSFDAGCASCEVSASLRVDGSSATSSNQNAQVGGDTDVANIGVQYVFEVDAGAHTFDLVAFNFDHAVGAVANVQFRQLVASFTPFGSTGGSTLGVSGPTTDAAGRAGE